jgi:predicted ribosomally synthesized peptide with SipW-like signal peptide
MPDKQMQGDNLEVKQGTGNRTIIKRPDYLWTYRLTTAKMVDGRAFHVLSVTDQFSRECLAIKLDWKIPSKDIVTQLVNLFASRAIPNYIISDGGLNAIDTDVCFWLEQLGCKARFIDIKISAANHFKGQNIEFINDEPPYQDEFRTLAEARERFENWRINHNILSSPPTQIQPVFSEDTVANPGLLKRSISFTGPGRIVLFGLLTLALVLGVAGTGSLAMFNDKETAAATFTAGTWGPQTVMIDIKPGEADNTVNPGSNGVLKVAVLTDAGFDALKIDPHRIYFGPGQAVPKSWDISDVETDGDWDIVFTFRMEDTGIRSGDTQAELNGFTIQNREFKGVDVLRTVP